MSDDRKMLEEILDRAASDLSFRASLLEDPQKAMREAGLLRATGSVSKRTCSETCGVTCTNTCGSSGSTCSYSS